MTTFIINVISHTPPWVWLILVGVTVLGLALNRALILPRSVQAQADGRFTIGGSWLPLALMLSIFALRYVASASMAIAPALHHEPAFAAAVSLLYGPPGGLSVGRAWRVLGHARRVSRLQMA